MPKVQSVSTTPGAPCKYKPPVVTRARNWYLTYDGCFSRQIKTVLDETQYHLTQRRRRIIFAPTLADAVGFLHECEGKALAFQQQVDGSFVCVPNVPIFYIVDGCSGDIFTSIAEAEQAWMDHGGAGDIRAVLDDYWQALECSLNPP
ncbi:hypothetical protein B0H14DRAFT_2654053 [Mycena olivaceomarginata]|nr:hypothetical protein B0H14DRAFT_2654053 [Mycena olivaceomarginata]